MRKLRAFGCRLLAHDPSLGGEVDGVSCVELAEILAQSDIVIVHAPLLPGAHHVIDRARVA